MDVQVPVSLGVYPWEKRRKRKVFINLMVEYNPATRSDALKDTLDYDLLVDTVREVALMRHYNLIETLVCAVGEAVLAMPQAAAVTVEIAKPGALRGVGGVSIVETFTR